MKNLILTGALGAAALLVAGCGDNDADTTADDTATVPAAATPAAAATTSASADWPAGTRIVEENGVTYRVNPDRTRVAIGNGGPRVVVENGNRYRVDASGTRHRINDDGIDIDLPAVPGVDVDVGTNKKGHLDIDVSTDGSDASKDRGGDR